jgi:hypothetical protein
MNNEYNKAELVAELRNKEPTSIELLLTPEGSG